MLKKTQKQCIKCIKNSTRLWRPEYIEKWKKKHPYVCTISENQNNVSQIINMLNELIEVHTRYFINGTH